MHRLVSELESKLDRELEEIAGEKNAVLRYDRSAKAVLAAIGELKELVQRNPFPALVDEISYFRELAPRVHARYFYYFRLFQVESLRACTSSERFREILDKEMAGIERFMEQHRDFCRYYYQQAKYWDEQLFTRRGRKDWPAEELSFVQDEDFCLGSYWVAWIQANERYRGWLEKAMAELRYREIAGRANKGQVPELKWMGSNTDLVELIYGLQLAGSFGEASVKQVARWFEVQFGVDLGDFYHTWQEIGRRKKSPTKFIDLMRERLLEKRDRSLE